jgi:hypothetical protein
MKSRKSKLGGITVKVVKILFGVLATLWALALIPKLLAWVSHRDAPLAFSHIMGSVVGILIASAISIALFRSAFRQ